MTTTAFQYIFDNAATLSINKRAVVAQTTTRDQTIRTVSRGGQVWRFEVAMPAGLVWSQARPYLEKIDAADRYTVGTVQINNSGYNSWLTPYQGNIANTNSVTASWTKGANTITLTGGQAASGYNFKAGDLIQLKSTGRVYSVAADVAYNSNTVTVNRAILDDSATAQPLVIGTAVTWSVVCIDIPDWTIVDRNIVSFSGSFKFVEYML